MLPRVSYRVIYGVRSVPVSRGWPVRWLSTSSGGKDDHNTTEEDKPSPASTRPKLGFAFFPEDDEETRQAKQLNKEILLERMRRSLLYDARVAHKEKLQEATSEQLSGDDVVAFPALTATSLATGDDVSLDQFLSNKVTLVTLSFQGLGKEQAVQYHEPFLDAFHLNTPHPLRGVQIVDVSYTEGWVFNLLNSLITDGIRRVTAPAMMPHTLVKYEPSTPATEKFCHNLRVHNRVLGYAFVVDWNGEVKWRAHHAPTPDEIVAMVTVTDTLLRQLRTDRG